MNVKTDKKRWFCEPGSVGVEALCLIVLPFFVAMGCSTDPRPACDPNRSNCSDTGQDTTDTGDSNASGSDTSNSNEVDAATQADATNVPDAGDDLDMGNATADGPNLILFHTPHGSAPASWPSSEQAVVQLPADLGEVLSPLAVHSSKLAIVNGLSLGLDEIPGDIQNPHFVGAAAILTGARGGTGAKLDGFDTVLGGGPSFDRLLGEQMPTDLASLVLGVAPIQPDYAHITWAALDQPQSPSRQPLGTVQSLFPNSTQPDIEALRTRAEQVDPADFPGLLDVQMDIAVAAVAAGRTRVVVIHNDHANGVSDYEWLGLDDMGFGVSYFAHESPETGWTAAQRYYATEFAKLISRLQDAGLGDNTVAVWFSEMGINGRAHSRRNLPVIYWGDYDGRLQTGNLVTVDERPFHDLLATFSNAMDVPMNQIGDIQVSPVGELLLQ